MADIELVVKIEEERYNQIKRCADNYLVSRLELAVKNGIPLPKGHGDLIDRSEISMPYDICDGDEAMDYVNEVSAIIETDKRESEDKE